METKESNSAASDPQPNLSGFDISSLLNNQSLVEVLKHLLSGAGAMAGNYFMWIKPMQEKMEVMSGKIQDQELRIKDLEKELAVIKINRPITTVPDSKEINKTQYFELNNQKSLLGSHPKSRKLRI